MLGNGFLLGIIAFLLLVWFIEKLAIGDEFKRRMELEQRIDGEWPTEPCARCDYYPAIWSFDNGVDNVWHVECIHCKALEHDLSRARAIRKWNERNSRHGD